MSRRLTAAAMMPAKLATSAASTKPTALAGGLAAWRAANLPTEKTA